MRGLSSRLRSDDREHDGGSMLIEMLVALVVFAVIAAGLASVSFSIIKRTDDNRYRSVAAQLLARDLDTVRAAGVSGIAAATGDTVDIPDVTIGGITYDLKREVSTYAPGAGECGVGVQTSVRVTTIVTWNERALDPGTAQNLGKQTASTKAATRTKMISGSTVITPSAGTYSETGKGTYGVTIYDRDNKPNMGVPVGFTTGAAGTLLGAGATTKTTNSDGCAQVKDLTAGTTYTAWTGTSVPKFVVPGFRYGLDSSYFGTGNTMVANTVKNASWVVDLAAALTLNVDTDATYPVPANMPFTVANSSFPSATKRWTSNYTASTSVNLGGALTANSFPYLFPSASGYPAWAGDCDDADPGTGSGLRAPTTVLEPAGSATATVKVAKATVTLQNLVGGQTFSLSATHKNDTNCINTTNQVYQLASGTAATGETERAVSFGLPYGTWTLTAKRGTTTITRDVNWTAANIADNIQSIAMAFS